MPRCSNFKAVSSGFFWAGCGHWFSGNCSIKIFLFQIQITSPNNTQTTMDFLEHQEILGRLQRKHRKAQEEAAALRAQVAELKFTPPRPEFCSPPAKPAYGRRICVGSHCTRLDTGLSGGWQRRPRPRVGEGAAAPRSERSALCVVF
jgi:hypothetical protein